MASPYDRHGLEFEDPVVLIFPFYVLPHSIVHVTFTNTSRWLPS